MKHEEASSQKLLGLKENEGSLFVKKKKESSEGEKKRVKICAPEADPHSQDKNKNENHCPVKRNYLLAFPSKLQHLLRGSDNNCAKHFSQLLFS